MDNTERLCPVDSTSHGTLPEPSTVAQTAKKKPSSIKQGLRGKMTRVLRRAVTLDGTLKGTQVIGRAKAPLVQWVVQFCGELTVPPAASIAWAVRLQRTDGINHPA